mmetsp:Transcript_64865/g.186626  ORF Transcript_64865/g.186626 Transcript_64865/m.186626 type:complete len:236 (-) Transcript_64865:384-1091(-)
MRRVALPLWALGRGRQHAGTARHFRRALLQDLHLGFGQRALRSAMQGAQHRRSHLQAHPCLRRSRLGGAGLDVLEASVDLHGEGAQLRSEHRRVAFRGGGRGRHIGLRGRRRGVGHHDRRRASRRGRGGTEVLLQFPVHIAKMLFKAVRHQHLDLREAKLHRHRVHLGVLRLRLHERVDELGVLQLPAVVGVHELEEHLEVALVDAHVVEHGLDGLVAIALHQLVEADGAAVVGI